MFTFLRAPYYQLIATRLIKKHAYKRKAFEDRDVLERIIFPYILAKFNPKKILDIGREDYQEFYNEFFRGRELWTIDIDPGKLEFGSLHHITDDVSNIKKYFSNNSFDFILMNGVFGWGLNQREQINKTFDAIHDILKPDGIFVFGFNDDIIPLKEIEGLKKLSPFDFKPLSGCSFNCLNGNHKYKFYTKQARNT
ncbi:methyltransferase domain-containing protein [Candidatus Parcubacteria bacterium]|nr:methyltransferase domain-containing protein [Candidatus Parcubacteria bacterium]